MILFEIDALYVAYPFRYLFNFNKGKIMSQEELLNLYLEKLRVLALEKIEENNLSVIDALKESLIYLEGEMQGY